MVTGEGFLLDVPHKFKSIVWRLSISGSRHDENHWSSLRLQVVLENVKKKKHKELKLTTYYSNPFVRKCQVTFSLFSKQLSSASSP